MKFVLAFMAALFVTSFSVCAADLDQVDYYELEPVQLSPMTASALDYGIALAAATDWSTTDSANLADIRNALTTLTSGTLLRLVYDMNADVETIKTTDNTIKTTLNTIAGYLDGVSSNNLADDVYLIRRGISDLSSGLVGSSNSVLWYASQIYNNTSDLHTILTAISADTDNILTKVITIDSNLASFYSGFSALDTWLRRTIAIPIELADSSVPSPQTNFTYGFQAMAVNTVFDGVMAWSNDRTLYSRIKQLQEVLASDDDKVLAESQKANREEIEQSFLNGSSGSTSLGASDFGDLSDVGGSVKDMLSLDGNATVSSFVSGMTAADSAGSGWFSETTRSQLDAVSSPASTYSRSDPYNMSGWQDRYYWLIGDDVNG